MRFDDSLKTVLAADASTAFGAQATFRQLADLIARGRVPADGETLARLRQLRDQVPASVRAAVARSFALAQPPRDLVAVFAEDEGSVAAAALSGVRLPPADWITLIPDLRPSGRAALRRRDDLDDDVVRALESFGSTDFALAYVPGGEGAEAAPAGIGTPPEADSGITPDQAKEPEVVARHAPVATGFDIADLVDRIASYQEQRASAPAAAPLPQVDRFRFQTDTAGTVRWTDVAPRGALIGADLIGAGLLSGGTTGELRSAMDVRDAVAQRTSFNDAWLTLDGAGPLGGRWQVSAVPLFDPATGCFTGYQGAAWRSQLDRIAAAVAEKGNAEGLRRLVHELRTPTNAIAGFSELIETQLLGPVAPPYRERASAIRLLAADLVATIEDLDMAARIEGQALSLRPDTVPLWPLLERVAADTQPLAAARGCALELVRSDDAAALRCDQRAAERLLTRLLATLVSATQHDEAIRLSVDTSSEGAAIIGVTCPRALAGIPEEELLQVEASSDDQLPGAPLLGTGFALRLARNLATQLGGTLTIAPDRIMVALPVDDDQAVQDGAGQAVST